MANVKKIIFDSKVLKDGTSPLAVRLIKDRKIKYFFIGHSIHKDDWDEESQSVKKTVKNHKRLNFLLKKQEALAEEQLMNMEGYHQEFTIEQLTKKIKRGNKAVSFTEFATEYLDGVLKEGRINVARSDRSRLKNIMAYNRQRPLYFHEINVAFLNNFITYLRSYRDSLPNKEKKKKKKISEKTVNNHLLMVRTIFNRAIREEIISRDIYPFGDKDKIQVKQVESHKVGLDQDELNSLENVELEEGSELWHARNAFVLSFNFAGVRISDLLQLTWSEIQGGRLHYQMGKTDASVSIPVPGKAKEILAYYKPDKHEPDSYVLPYLHNADREDPTDLERKINSAISKINKKLKKVAKLAGIDKNLSTHISRHTFGNLAGDKIPIPMLQKLYRHKSMLTTAIYQGNFMHKDTDEALLKVVNGK
jgi:integrase/recombinase XerD